MNTYLNPLLDLTFKSTCLVWVEFSCIQNCCKYNMSFCVDVIHCDWGFLDLVLIFISSGDLVLWPLTLVNIYALSFFVDPGQNWKIYCKLPLSMCMAHGWNIQHVGTVSVLVFMKFDVHYCFVLSFFFVDDILNCAVSGIFHHIFILYVGP